jgi:hypothetical protein
MFLDENIHVDLPFVEVVGHAFTCIAVIPR